MRSTGVVAAFAPGLAVGGGVVTKEIFPLVDDDRLALIANGQLGKEARLAWRYVGE